jgi:hypothetical protein
VNRLNLYTLNLPEQTEFKELAEKLTGEDFDDTRLADLADEFLNKVNKLSPAVFSTISVSQWIRDFLTSRLKNAPTNAAATAAAGRHRAGSPHPPYRDRGSGKPSAKRGRFEKGSAEAKAFMAELRAKRKKM